MRPTPPSSNQYFTQGVQELISKQSHGAGLAVRA